MKYLVIFFISSFSLFSSGGVTPGEPDIDYVYLQKGRYVNWTPEEIQAVEYKQTPLGVGTALYSYNDNLLTTLSSADTVYTSYFDFADKAVSLLSAGYLEDDVFSGTQRYIVRITQGGDGSYLYWHHLDPNPDLSDPNVLTHVSYNTQAYIAQYYYALTPVKFTDDMIETPDTSNSRFEVGDQIIATRDIFKSNGAEILQGNILTVVRINANGLPIVSSTPNSWLSTHEQSYFDLYTGEPDRPHEDNGFHVGETYSYIMSPSGSPVLVGGKFVIELKLFYNSQGQIYGERKGGIQFQDFKIWANNEYGPSTWLRGDNDWFQLNLFALGSSYGDQVQHNSWTNLKKEFSPGDFIGENSTYICTLGFNKVELKNNRPYSSNVYYDYDMYDIHMPISWKVD